MLSLMVWEQDGPGLCPCPCPPPQSLLAGMEASSMQPSTLLSTQQEGASYATGPLALPCACIPEWTHKQGLGLLLAACIPVRARESDVGPGPQVS